MSEYKTLDSWFPDGKPDGRKFWRADWDDTMYFVPYFRTVAGKWYGLGENGMDFIYYNTSVFKEWTSPKQTKKVKMYKPIRKGYDIHYRTRADDEWHTDKDNFTETRTILGWLEMEVEIEE